jgi:hypothetical protein
MDRVRIVDMVFSPQDYRVRIDLIGHPTACLQKSHEIAQSVLGDDSWLIKSIDGKHVGDLPSDFNMKVVAERRI